MQKWHDEVEAELRKQREAAEFRAREAEILRKDPFIPKPSEKPLSEIDNFELHSDRRAAEREEYEMKKRERDVEKESLRRQVCKSFIISTLL